MTMDAYLAYDDGTDARFELVDGVLIEMSVESRINAAIARFLLFELAKYVPQRRLAHKDIEVEVSGRRASCRLPDLLIHSEDSYAALQTAQQAVLVRDMPPPEVVIEVVFPGLENRNRDYRHKRTEYAARGITEYWIVDPECQQVTICLWVDGQYEDTIFTGDTPIGSTVVPAFQLPTTQIMSFGEA